MRSFESVVFVVFSGLPRFAGISVKLEPNIRRNVTGIIILTSKPTKGGGTITGIGLENLENLFNFAGRKVCEKKREIGVDRISGLRGRRRVGRVGRSCHFCGRWERERMWWRG
jgi:hypothetical protein